LVGAVALDPLRAAVPRHDDPVGIEHEDRVVLDALDQQRDLLGTGVAARHGASEVSATPLRRSVAPRGIHTPDRSRTGDSLRQRQASSATRPLGPATTGQGAFRRMHAGTYGRMTRPL